MVWCYYSLTFQGDEKRSLAELPVGWDGEETCAISNRPRESKLQYFGASDFSGRY
ncbi:hypothetical protein [Okeania sp. KiyG1]|uniref:hypothetical protein n=1 Tax=Okeania sp. KiyG1 TaxID=2720165 RepID=UPI00192501A6|nr:hypothetical protein [Okeania sp. KiyG1]